MFSGHCLCSYLVRVSTELSLYLQLTFADIGVAMVVTGLKERVGEDAIKPFPKLSALRDHVYNLPKIKHWVETRPQTAM